jgi:hypothetical protein
MPSLSIFGEVVKPGRSPLDDERREAVGLRLRLGPGVDDERVRVGPVRDPELGAVEAVEIAVSLGPQGHAQNIRACARFAHRERADVLAADEAREIVPLLLVGAVEVNLVHAEVGVGRVREAD